MDFFDQKRALFNRSAHNQRTLLNVAFDRNAPMRRCADGLLYECTMRA